MNISRAEAELAVETFLDKLERWLLEQREWPILMGAADRQTRRRMAKAIADIITTMPKQRFDQPVLNRQLRRKLLQEMQKAEKAWWEGLE